MSLSCSEAGYRGSTQRPSRRNLTRVAQRSGQPIHGDLDRLGYEEAFVAGAVAAKQLELDSVERQQVGEATFQEPGLALVFGNKVRMLGLAEVNFWCAGIHRR